MTKEQYTMAVKIRLSRVGTKHAPLYRIVAVDSHDKRDGRALEILGTYNPIKDVFDQLHEDKVKAWIAKGALMTDSVKKLSKKFGSLPKIKTESAPAADAPRD